MAKRRNLKKSVNYIIGELFAECTIICNFIPGADKDKAQEIMTRILLMQSDFVSRISHTEPGNVKNFYKKFRSDFQSQVDAIIDDITKLH